LWLLLTIDAIKVQGQIIFVACFFMKVIIVHRGFYL